MSKPTTLTDEEKRVIKALLQRGVRNQDIHALVNYCRPVTVNFGRITNVKNNDSIIPASDGEVEFYKRKKRNFDPVTGLNLYDDERLIRAREAMLLAVTIFNGNYKFKAEIFCVLSNIAWTYLLHQFYLKKNINPLNKDGTTFALSYMLGRSDCPLTKGIKNNLQSIKSIRDQVEHQLLRRSDTNWLPLFQACCLNFDAKIIELFGERLTLQNELSVALHFSKLSMDQAGQLEAYDIPAEISALDALLTKELSQEDVDDIEYQFKVIYTLDSASKGKAHIQFLHPDSAEGKEVKNVLQKFKIADELYPLKPGTVVDQVKKRTGESFTMKDHTGAWKKMKIRPEAGSKSPEKTNREYCIYHPAYGSYTYNEKWVEKLISLMG